MRYYIVPRDAGRKAYQLFSEGRMDEAEALLEEREDVRGTEDGTDVLRSVEEFESALVELDESAKGSELEVALVEPIHRALRSAREAVGDRDFWSWLSLSRRIVRDTIVRRHDEDGRFPKAANFGLGSPAEGLCWRAYFRAEVTADGEAADYELARRGTQDFWRSHVLRLTYSGCRHFVRVWVDYCYPNGRARFSVSDIRELQKRVLRSYAVRPFELMDERELIQLLDSLSEGLERRV